MVKNILFVDDDEPLLKMLKQFFQRQGYNFFEAVNKNEAFEILEKENIDLMFLDIKLGEESGIEICREIREKYPELYIAAVSGFLTKKEIKECENSGFNKIMSKPVSMNEMKIFVNML